MAVAPSLRRRLTLFAARHGLTGSVAASYANIRMASSSWASVETPNPDVRKFELRSSAPSSSRAVPGAAARSQLLALEGVRDVFVVGAGPGTASVTEHFVSVTRASSAASWETLVPRVQACLDSLPDAADAMEPVSASPSTEAAVPEGVVADIHDVLEHRVRPTVQADGGDVEFAHWNDQTGQVALYLRGACRGCPQSAVTLRETIFRTLKHFVPEVRSVVAEDDWDAAAATDDPCADLLWDHCGEANAQEIAFLAEAGTPFFSTFMGKVEGKRLRQVKFSSRVELKGRTPEHVIVKCSECNAKRSIEDPSDLLREDKGNRTGNAAVVICPTCCVLISR